MEADGLHIFLNILAMLTKVHTEGFTFGTGRRFRMRRFVIFILFLTVAQWSLGSEPLLSLSHLQNLKWNFELNTKAVTAWWVYSKPALSNANEYVKTASKNEGAACVDDAARAVVLLLQLYEETKATTYLKDAKGGLNFLMAMEENNGEFYNFVYRNGKINRYGITSRRSVSWWTVRGFWALSMGARVFKSIDVNYSKKLFTHAFAAYMAIKSTLQSGLVQGYSDMSSVFLLGLSELYFVDRNSDIAFTAQEVADGILRTQSKSGFTNGVFFVSESANRWNGWGARQVQALARAGRVFKEQKWIKAAEYAVLHFYPKLIFSLGPIYAMSGSVISYPQISYAQEVMVSGLTELYMSTKKEIYADMAYVAISWYFYNNNLKALMYTKDGKGYDGLEEFFRNIDSGAESTICADISLSDLMELSGDFVADFLKAERTFQNGIILFNASKMDSGFGGVKVVQKDLVANGYYAVLSPYSTLSKNLNVKEEGTYDVYVSYFNTMTGGKLAVYLGNEHREFHVNTLHNFEFAKVLSNVQLSKGNERLVIEYVNSSNSAKIAVAQVILLPHVIVQTLLKGKKYKLTSVINLSNRFLNIRTFTAGKISKAHVYTTNGSILKSQTIPPGGFAFVEWFSTSTVLQIGTSSIRFEKSTVARTFEKFVMIDLSRFFNNTGIVSIHSNVPANFDNPNGVAGAAYPLEFLEKKVNNGLLTSQIESMRVPFYMGKLSSNKKDNMTLQNQTISVKRANYKALFILGSADHGTHVRMATLYYSDGTSKKVAIKFADWFFNSLPGEWVVFRAPYGLDLHMQKINGEPKLYVQKIELDGSKELIGIKFPNQITLHIFAITLLR